MSSTSLSMNAAAVGRLAASCATFLATDGNSCETARDILHFTEPRFVVRDELFEFCDATSRSWDTGDLLTRFRFHRTWVTDQVTRVLPITFDDHPSHNL